jgi:hypothetical protein
METTGNTASNQENKGSGNKFFMILSGVLFVLVLVLGWQFYSQKTKADDATTLNTSLTVEKDSLNKELADLQSEYTQLQSDNESLQGQLSAKDSVIQIKIVEIQKLIQSGDASQLKKAKAELANLRNMNKMYEMQIDSLKQANARLTDENVMVKAEVETEKGKNSELSKVNTKLSEKVALGSVLKANDLFATGVFFKSNGEKEKTTSKAKKVEKIRTCFKLSENKVVDKGTKDVYLRIIAPDGKVLTQGDESAKFTSNGQDVLYSVKKDIYYDNKEAEMCIYASKGMDLMSGNYTIEVFADGHLIGSALLELK